MRKSLRFSPRALQHEFSSHAPDFGIAGNWNKATAALFQRAIEEHVAAAPVVAPGTFRGIISVTHYFNPVTGLWAAFDLSDTFVASWKLYRTQVADLLTKGDVR